MSRMILLTIAFTCWSFVDTANADWPQFRGPNSSGLAAGPAPPTSFGPGQSELWRLPLESGHSSPCVVGERIFLTTFDEDEKRLAVVSIDRKRGEVQWRNDVAAEQIERGHPSFNPASSTPASDGERVVAYFGSYGLVCFDVHGRKLWDFRLPLAKSYGGNAASPVIAGDRVILYRGNYVDHFLLALDKRTGKELWRVPQEESINAEMACTACPIVSGKTLIVHTARKVQALELESGRQIWSARCATTATSTPVLAGGEVIVAAWNKLGEPALRPSFPDFEALVKKHDRDGDGLIGRDELPTLWIFHRPEGAEAPENGATIRFGRTDRNKDGKIDAEEWSATIGDLDRYRAQAESNGILAIRLDHRGAVIGEGMRTLETRGIPEVPSPLCDGEYVYFVKNGGILTCLELETGKRVYRIRTRGRGTHYASPVMAGGKLFTIAGDGRITVLKSGPKPEILATNDMGDRVYATPAIVDGTIYVRTHSALFAFGPRKSGS